MTFIIALVMLFSTVVDGQIVLDEPTVMPTDLNHLWELMKTDSDWQDWGKCPEPTPSPWMNLDMAGEMFTGKSDEFDNEAFDVLSLIFWDRTPGHYSLGICNKGDKIYFYGQGLRDFLLWFNYPDKFYEYRYPIIVDNLSRGIEKVFQSLGFDE